LLHLPRLLLIDHLLLLLLLSHRGAITPCIRVRPAAAAAADATAARRKLNLLRNAYPASSRLSPFPKAFYLGDIRAGIRTGRAFCPGRAVQDLGRGYAGLR
jgi:hypothetical protein